MSDLMEYQELLQKRELAALARWKSLAGSPAARNALVAKTAALRRDEGWDPIEYVTESERLVVANG